MHESAETLTLLLERGDTITEHLVTDVVSFPEAPATLVALAERRHIVRLVLGHGV